MRRSSRQLAGALLSVGLFVFSSTISFSQQNLLTNINSRQGLSLNGTWQYIVDPYGTGFYDYRYMERRESDPEAYWNTDRPATKTDRKEHGYADVYSIKVPGDWNSQDPKFLYYEGIVWYKKSFDYKKASAANRVFLYFGAVNYRADVYLNGKKLGMHKGGFTPFNFEVPDSVLKEKDNFLIVKVDNKRDKDEVPTLNTDWWNYGGITRDVKLIELPATFIQDFVIQLKKPTPGKTPAKEVDVEGWVKLNKTPAAGETLTIEIPELKIKKQVTATAQSTA